MTKINLKWFQVWLRALKGKCIEWVESKQKRQAAPNYDSISILEDKAAVEQATLNKKRRKINKQNRQM